MSIKAKEKPLSEIFHSDYEFIVPGYQRPYSWGEEQAEKLFNDLYDAYNSNLLEYFLGSIVLIKKEKYPRSEIIDGQQRLTSLTILWSCIYNNLPSETEEQKDMATDVLSYIYEKGKPSQGILPKDRLALRPKDQNFFQKYIQRSKIDALFSLQENSIETEAQENILNNAKVFNNKISNIKNELDEFIKFLTKKCFLVVVETVNQASAIRIFSVMNNRGLDLKPTDILKSDIISNIPSNEQDLYSEKWENLENKIGRDNFALVFSHIHMIHSKDKLRKTLAESFIEKVAIKYPNKKNFIDEALDKYIKFFDKIINNSYESTQHGGSINDNLKWLNRILNTDWVPTLLSFMSSSMNTDQKLEEFLIKLERLSVYLMISGANENKRLSRYKDVLEAIESNNYSLTLEKLALKPEEREEFIGYLNGDVYHLYSAYKRYLILRLDQFISDGAANYDPNVLTIEHVLPQTIEEGSEWSRWWPDLEERDRWVHKIGNLLPLNRRRNSAAKNYEFERKKSAYFSGNNNISSYALTTQVISELIWTPEVVERRQNSLISILKERWSL
jgi:uncharacterized protein with ParB-like and HNH nuclease domain